MRRAFAAALALMAGAALIPGAVAAQKSRTAPAQVEQGRTVFTHNCAPCHGRGPGDDGSKTLPGTAALDARYKGEIPGALELRGDLTAETLTYFVRHGLGAMPMFRKAEVSDADIAAIAAYLKSSAASHKKAAK